MRFRQVHLDFHTSEDIENIGGEFSREQFQACLKMGHVDSITLFSKCHHGWAYHPSHANKIHPNLHFDLLHEQIEAAHELGIKTPVYLSAGFDERIAREAALAKEVRLEMERQARANYVEKPEEVISEVESIEE